MRNGPSRQSIVTHQAGRTPGIAAVGEGTHRLLDVRTLSLALSAFANLLERADFQANQKEMTGVARVEIGGRREGQEVWARWIDGRVQGEREFLRIAGLDPGTRFEDPHAFVELVEKLLDEGTASIVLDLPQGQA
jgi:hypothetical protein